VQENIVLAGVGGQGILTMARAIGLAGLRRGWQLKQAEVHGMSQRGGAVQSHLRLADHELHSDLIPLGEATMVLAVEPLEALRYVQYLRADGALIASTNPFVNIPDYPPLPELLTRIAQLPRHILLDAERCSKLVGSGRAANIVLLGAASLFLTIEATELEAAVGELFAAKGPKVVELNRTAFGLGRRAGQLYRQGLERGEPWSAVLERINGLSREQLLGSEAAATADAAGEK